MQNSDFEKEYAKALGTETAKGTMELAKAALLPPAQEVGKGLADLVYVVTAPIRFPVERLRLVIEAAQSKFREGIHRKVASTPQEKLCEPDPQVIFNAIHDAQYCVEKDELREMFENLIASAANADKVKYVHPALPNIIKQMTAQDAQNLALFAKKAQFPIARYRLQDKNGNGFNVRNAIFLANPNFPDIHSQSSSISCLASLGLLSIDYASSLTQVSYEAFEKTDEYIFLKSHLLSPTISSFMKVIDLILYTGDVSLEDFGMPKEIPVDMLALATPAFRDFMEQINMKFSEVKLMKGIVSLTDLGRNFIKACL